MGVKASRRTHSATWGALQCSAAARAHRLDSTTAQCSTTLNSPPKCSVRSSVKLASDVANACAPSGPQVLPDKLTRSHSSRGPCGRPHGAIGNRTVSTAAIPRKSLHKHAHMHSLTQHNGQKSNTLHSLQKFNVCSRVNLAKDGAKACAPCGPSSLPDNAAHESIHSQAQRKQSCNLQLDANRYRGSASAQRGTRMRHTHCGAMGSHDIMGLLQTHANRHNGRAAHTELTLQIQHL